MYDSEEARNVYCAMVSSWGRNAEFNFTRIDEIFSELSRYDNLILTALNRLAYPIDLSDEYREKYVAFLKEILQERPDRFYLFDDDDLSGLMRLEQYGIFFTRANIQQLINAATKRQNTELVEYLLEQKSKLS